MAANNLHLVGIEVVTGRRRAWTDDTNTGTNDSPDAERAIRLLGMRALAGYLGDERARACGVADAV